MTSERASIEEYADRETYFGIVPALSKHRLYSWLDLTFVGGSFAIATWCYVQGAAVAGMTTMPQATANTFGAVLGVIPLICLIGVMSSKYGIDHWLLSRSTFGYFGVFLLLVCLMAAAQGFMALNATIYAGSITGLLERAGWQGATGAWAYKLIAVTCPVLGYVIAFGGVRAVRWSSRVMGISLLAVGAVIIILIFSSSEAGRAWHAEPLYGLAAGRDSYMLAAEWNIAFVLAWFIGIGGLTRVAKSEPAASWGLNLGYGVLMALFIFIGVAVAFVATQKGAPPVADPTTYLLEVGGPALGTLALLLVGVANISTNAVSIFLNVLATKVLWPSWRYEYVGAFYTLVIIVLLLWGGILDYYGTFLAVVGMLNGPAVALVVIDYWIVRRRKLSLRSVFERRQGAYFYTAGLNLPAWVAFLAGVGSYLATYDPIRAVPRLQGLFNLFTASGLAVIVTAAVYLALASVPPIRRYLRKDLETGDVC